MNQSKRESLSLESESQKKTKYDTSETEDKFIQEIRKDESLFKESFRKIKSVLNLQLSLVQNMIKNPIFKHLKLKLLPEVEGVLNDLEDSESSLLFNANIRVPGDIDIRSLFADSVEMNLLLSKFLVGLYTDISNPDDMLHLARKENSSMFTEEKRINIPSTKKLRLELQDEADNIHRLSEALSKKIQTMPFVVLE